MFKKAKANPIYLYHGTSLSLLPSILSQGLVGNPKTRKWETDPSAGFKQPSRKSLPGVYLTNSIFIALESSHVTPGIAKINLSAPSLIVLVQVQPQSLYVDEDNLLFIADIGITNPRMISVLYNLAAINPLDSKVQQAKNKYVQNMLKEIKSLRNNPSLLESVKKLLEDGFFVALNRKAAYIKDLSNKPDSGEAENRYKFYQDKLSKTLKTIARSSGEFTTEYDEEAGGIVGTNDFTARFEGNIGFVGSNKIVGIFREFGQRGERFIKLVYPNSWDQIPTPAKNKILQDWDKI